MDSPSFDMIEKELLRHVKCFCKGGLVKATEFAVKRSRSKYATDLKNLGTRHYEFCVRKVFGEIKQLFIEKGILEKMAILHDLKEQQKSSEATSLRRPTGIAPTDIQLLADVINSALLQEEKRILEDLKKGHNILFDQLIARGSDAEQ